MSTDLEALTSDELGDRDKDESSVISKRDNDPGAQLLESYKYRVPTFTVFYERLWHAVCQVVEEAFVCFFQGRLCASVDTSIFG